MPKKSFGASRRALSIRAGLVLTLSAALAACGSSDGGEKSKQEAPPSQVKVKSVQPHDVQVFAEYPGRVEGKRTVQVIGRVNGILEKKSYTEGSIVKKGQLLYTIDPRPFQATVDQRKAALASARAAAANSTRIYNRTKRLYQANAVSEAERDQALATYESDQASVQQAKANLESAQIDLGYTKVSSPLTGVTSLREVDEGALIQANQTMLTSITQLDPVYVLFALPEDDALVRRKALEEMGGKTTDKTTSAATIILSDGTEFPNKAVVDFTQSTINPQTGTVQIRAIVKNTDNALMPGRYVRARVKLQDRDAITVPSKSLSDDGQRTTVFVIKNGKAEQAPVELGPNVDDGVVITKGLKAGDKVVVSGLGTLKGGASVKIVGDSSGADQQGQKAVQNGDDQGSDQGSAGSGQSGGQSGGGSDSSGSSTRNNG